MFGVDGAVDNEDNGGRVVILLLELVSAGLGDVVVDKAAAAAAITDIESVAALAAAAVVDVDVGCCCCELLLINGDSGKGTAYELRRELDPLANEYLDKEWKAALVPVRGSSVSDEAE